MEAPWQVSMMKSSSLYLETHTHIHTHAHTIMIMYIVKQSSWEKTQLAYQSFICSNKTCYHTNLLTIFYSAVAMVTKIGFIQSLSHTLSSFPSLSPSNKKEISLELVSHVKANMITPSCPATVLRCFGDDDGRWPSLCGDNNLAFQAGNYHISIKAGVTKLLSGSLG